jgi:hypothetical protein
MTRGRVVIGQGDRRNTQIVSLFGQHRWTVRSVGERGVGMKIYHPSSVPREYDILGRVCENVAVPPRPPTPTVVGG